MYVYMYVYMYVCICVCPYPEAIKYLTCCCRVEQTLLFIVISKCHYNR